MYYVKDIDKDGGLDETLLANDTSVISGVDTLVGGWSISDSGLTLNGFNYNDAVGGGMLEVIGNGSITLTGTNNISAPVYTYKESDTSEVELIDFASYGIYSTGNLTLNGSGNSTISKENTNTYIGNSCFIPVVSEGNITVDNGTYNLSSNNYGMQLKGGSLELNEGTVNVTAARGLYSAGDFIVDGGELEVSTRNSGVTVAGNIDINSGNILLRDGTVAIEQTAVAPKLDICNAYVTLQGNERAISTAATLDIHAYVEGSILYDGTGAIQIIDINDTFYDEVLKYDEYKYFNLEPAVMSANISWGDLSYSATEKWSAEDLLYSCTFTPDNNSNKISITNVGEENEDLEESNIPIVARISYTAKDFGNTHSIKYDLTGKIDNSNVVPTRKNLVDKSIVDGYQIDIGKELVYTLGLSVVPYNGKSLADLSSGTQQIMGDVTITLSDY